VFDSSTTPSGIDYDSTADISELTPKLTEVETASAETAMILSSCHSLVVVDEADNEQEQFGPPNLVGLN
jgi:hypothetical protein